jgi:CO/xanthine dehydrogenase Mo-binding subunit
LPLPEGGGHRNAAPIYTIANARVAYDFVPAMPLRVSALRSLGAYLNIFSIESFIDELAQAAQTDPVEFRLQHLDDARVPRQPRASAGRATRNRTAAVGASRLPATRTSPPIWRSRLRSSSTMRAAGCV